MIRSGIGVALLPRWSVSKYIDQDDLVGIPFSKQGFRLQWNVSILKDARLPVFQQHFIDMFSEFTPVSAKKKKSLRIDCYEDLNEIPDGMKFYLSYSLMAIYTSELNTVELSAFNLRLNAF